MGWDLLPGCQPLHREFLESGDPHWITEGHFGLLREAYWPFDPDERDHRMEILEDREESGLLSERQLMILDYYRGYRAMTRQEVDDTVMYAKRSIAAFKGDASRFAVASYDLLLNMVREADIDEALKLEREAGRLCHRPQQTARHLIAESSLNYDAGRLRECARTADKGLRELTGFIQGTSRIELRNTRADAWAELGYVSAAMREVEIIVGFRSVRESTNALVPALEVIGNCHLYGGSPPHLSLSAYANCWEIARSCHSPSLQGPALRMLLDAILDLQAWDTLTQYGEELRLSEGITPTLEVLSTGRRAEALHLKSVGNIEGAEVVLRDGVDEVRAWVYRLPRAKYLHHLGLVLSEVSHRTEDHARATEALGLFGEARQALAVEGYDYHRGQVLLSEAKHLAGLGHTDDALHSLNDAIANARRIQSKQLLAECLRLRAEWTS